MNDERKLWGIAFALGNKYKSRNEGLAFARDVVRVWREKLFSFDEMVDRIWEFSYEVRKQDDENAN